MQLTHLVIHGGNVRNFPIIVGRLWETIGTDRADVSKVVLTRAWMDGAIRGGNVPRRGSHPLSRILQALLFFDRNFLVRCCGCSRHLAVLSVLYVLAVLLVVITPAFVGDEDGNVAPLCWVPVPIPCHQTTSLYQHTERTHNAIQQLGGTTCAPRAGHSRVVVPLLWAFKATLGPVRVLASRSRTVLVEDAVGRVQSLVAAAQPTIRVPEGSSIQTRKTSTMQTSSNLHAQYTIHKPQFLNSGAMFSQ